MKNEKTSNTDPVRLMSMWYEVPVKEIARHFGCSQSKIYRMAKLLSLCPRKRVAEMQKLFKVYDAGEQLRVKAMDMTLESMVELRNSINERIPNYEEFLEKDYMDEDTRDKFKSELAQFKLHFQLIGKQMSKLATQRSEFVGYQKVLNRIGHFYPKIKEEIIRQTTGLDELQVEDYDES